jgi:peptidoglycan/xylan/chitin deacetylase (PgdA/CDA1 family)
VSDVLVLGYHAVSETWRSHLAVTPMELHRQLSALVARGYVGARFHQAATEPPAAKTLAVTFDDAYRSVLDLALPILAGLELPATVFVPTQVASEGGFASWAGVDLYTGGPDAHELAVMSWGQLGKLSSLGWEIGSHTRSHPRLTGLRDTDLMEELEGSRRECEVNLDSRCRSIAFPYGDVDSRVTTATGAAGYLSAAGLPSSRHLGRPTALNWPRVGVFSTDGPLRFALKVSPLSRRLRTIGSRADASLAQASPA